MQHIRLAHTPEDLDNLILSAEEWIKDCSRQLSVFSDENPGKLLHLDYCSFLGVRYAFFNDQIRKIQENIGLVAFPLC
jgi:hypothetical protein